MELWLKHSSAFTYADDTSSSVTGKTLDEVKKKLEEDADQVLKFMASNGLVANPSKTTLMILNHNSDSAMEINVGGKTIIQEKSSKLLGVIINEKENWSTQINEKGGVISSLNQRLFLVRRLRNQVNQERLRKVAESIWTSRLRYGLQLYSKVRLTSECPLTKDMENLQLAQNKLLRTHQNVRIKDKISIASMLDRQKMMSVNQLQAQIKLTEMWKASNVKTYPLNIGKRNLGEEIRITRSVTNENLNEPKTLTTFIGDATRLWNKAPLAIRSAKSISTAKKEIKIFCKNLPI